MDAIELWQGQDSHVAQSNRVLMNFDIQGKPDGTLAIWFELCIPSLHFERDAWHVASARIISKNGKEKILADENNRISTMVRIDNETLATAGPGALVEFDVRLKWPGVLSRKSFDMPLRAPIDFELSNTRRLRLALEKDNEEEKLILETTRAFSTQQRQLEMIGRWEFFDRFNNFYSPRNVGEGRATSNKPDRTDLTRKLRIKPSEVKDGRVEYVYSDDVTEHKLKYVLELPQPQKK